MVDIHYSKLEAEAGDYWQWNLVNPVLPMAEAVAKEGAGSELRTPLMHYGTVMPVYLAAIRYLKKIQPPAGAKLIELGCGTGRALSYLKTIFPELEIWGVDYAKGAIDYASNAYGKLGVKFIHIESAEQTQLPAASFDFVLSSHVIEHINQAAGRFFLEETRRLLKAGGYAFIGTPERKNCQDIYRLNPGDAAKFRLVPPHEHEYTLAELKNEADQIFPTAQVRVNRLYNPLFRKIFQASINRFKPDGGWAKGLADKAYRAVRDGFPRVFFDSLVRTGTAAQMRISRINYCDILSANRIGQENEQDTPDNLLLVCEK